MIEEKKYCKDCKWVERWTPLSWRNRYCKHPECTEPFSFVAPQQRFANLARQFGPCYSEGKLWEKR